MTESFNRTGHRLATEKNGSQLRAGKGRHAGGIKPENRMAVNPVAAKLLG